MTRNALIIALALGFGVMTLIATRKSIEYKVVTQTKTDTLFIEIPSDTVFLSKLKYISYPIHDTVFLSEQGDTITHYSGSFFVDSAVTVLYELDVKGLVYGMNFGAIKNYPPKEVITNTITKQESMDYKGLWIGGGVTTMGDLLVGLSVQNSNKQFSVDYNPIDKYFAFGYKLRLFKIKNK